MPGMTSLRAAIASKIACFSEAAVAALKRRKTQCRIIRIPLLRWAPRKYPCRQDRSGFAFHNPWNGGRIKRLHFPRYREGRFPLSPFKGLHALARQFVGALVFRMTGMALHPMQRNLMALLCGLQRLPKLDILDRLVVGGFPALLFPAEYPLGDAVLHIGAIRVKIDLAGAFQRIQR
ncbi:hypothetical protein AT6N2_C1676 [Agrobacterium tumefaciens]|nr:hypothetical protein AT6N2_C1676 [Agrobacterium tumefaciens]